MRIKKRVELLRDNLLVGSHVYRKGDVVEIDSEVAQNWLKTQVARDAGDKPLTQPGKPKLRSEIIAEQALALAQPSEAERAVRQPRRVVPA
jgi:hypothetical protein